MQELDHQTTSDPGTLGLPARHAGPSHALPSTEAPEEFDGSEEDDPSPFLGLTRGRVVIVLSVLLALVLMAVIPPLINVGRYRRRIANSIGLSLGRPVHIDSVTLNILPMPGFTLENFVVQEDPRFGAEPVIRAQQVRATLRISSLWRRRVEFSRISLDDPSVNLVHLSNGQWNLESILLQASRMPAAPTQQKGASQAARFPYIEATGARVNLKMGLEKMPISLTDADFAIWLPEPHQWHLRLKATPARTDAASTDTGLLRVEGTLGQAPTLGDVPIHLNGRWTAAPLGAVSRIFLGRDAGLRGQMTVSAALLGTVQANQLDTRLELREVRKADFVPAALLGADIACTAAATNLFHTLSQLHCSWPPSPQQSSHGPQATGLTLTGSVPDLFHPTSADLQAHIKDLPASTLLDVLRAVSQRTPSSLQAAGSVEAAISCCIPLASTPAPSSPHHRLKPSVAPPVVPSPLAGDFTITITQLSGTPNLSFLTPPPRSSGNTLTLSALPTSVIAGSIVGNQLVLKPLLLPLGGKDPATLDLHADISGYTIHLSGPLLRSRWNLLVQALPPLGDGMDSLLPVPVNGVPESPAHVDLTAHRSWTGIETKIQTGIQTAPEIHQAAITRRRPSHRPSSIR